MPHARVVSVQTGQPQTHGQAGAADPLDRPWTSAIWKSAVGGKVWAGPQGLAGDSQVSTPTHGGLERALLFYCAEHYGRWLTDWGGSRLDPGSFGENLTVEGLDEHVVCLGDVFQMGDLVVEVSGPREPCKNLERRHRRPGLRDEVVASGRAGWYARVQHDGWVEAGMDITLVDRPFPQWPISRAASVKRHRSADRGAASLLAACPALLADWRARLGEKGSEAE